MGFVLNVDLETSNGPSHEVYVRIESLVVNRVTSKALFQMTYWTTQDYAIKFSKVYVEEEDKVMSGLVQERVLYYETEESEGVEVILPNMITVDLAREEEVEVPIFEKKKVSKEVPYTSFDEEGEEITLYRTVTSEELIKVGSNLEIRKVIDPSIAKDIFAFGYEMVKQKLSNTFPVDKIEIK